MVHSRSLVAFVPIPDAMPARRRHAGAAARSSGTKI